MKQTFKKGILVIKEYPYIGATTERNHGGGERMQI